VLTITDLVLEVPGRRVLDGVDLTVAAGEVVAVLGPSGAGKTSLLNCAAGVVAPTSGRVEVDGDELTRLSGSKRSALRLSRMGIVFQFAELLPGLTAVQNVELPLRLLGHSRIDARERALIWLDRLGVAERGPALPEALSGGELQRIAIARAMVHDPVLVIADEPTGMLDAATTREVVDVLVTTARGRGTALLVATHDAEVAGSADRVLRLTEAALASGQDGAR